MKVYQDKTCDHCGATFTPTSGSQKRCSKMCQDEKRRQRQSVYNCDYRNRPEIKVRKREIHRKYINKPEVRAQRLESDRKRKNKPESKARHRVRQLERYRRMGGDGYRRNFEFLLKRDGPICGICKGLLEVNDDIHVDHIRPVSKGGTNDLDNLQLAHAYCNKSKQDKWDEDTETLSDTQLTLFPYHKQEHDYALGKSTTVRRF